MLRFKTLPLTLAFVLFFALPAAAQPFTLNEQFQLPGITNGRVEWGDFDNNGFFDVVLSGEYTNNIDCYSALIPNVHSGIFDIHVGIFDSSYFCAIQSGDVNNDNKIDIAYDGYNVIKSLKITELFINKGNFILHRSDIEILIPMFQCNFNWGDVNNNGYQDILHSGQKQDNDIDYQLYSNDKGVYYGSNIIIQGFLGTRRGDLAFCDMDNNGYIDCTFSGNTPPLLERITKIYKNNGVRFDIFNTVLKDMNITSLDWADYNNDGFLDIVIIGSYVPDGQFLPIRQTSLYTNIEGAYFIENNLTNFISLSEGSVKWGDYDNDGYPDVLMSGWHTMENGINTGITKLYRNNGDETFSEVVTDIKNFVLSTSAWADYDNDDDLDILIAGGVVGAQRYTHLYTNNAEVGNIRPNVINNLETEITDTTVLFSWDEGTDLNQPSAGLNYNLYIHEQGNDSTYLRSPMAFPYKHEFNGKRLIARRGEIQGIRQNGRVSYLMNISLDPCKVYYWSVQSIDASFAGGAFAPEVRIALDTEPPVITCPPSQSVTIPESETGYAVFGTALDAVASDNCSATLRNSVNGNPTLQGISLPAGIHTLTWTATDSTGNSNSCTMQLTVKDFVGIKTLPEVAITVTPNPTSGKLTIDYLLLTIENVDVTDMAGKKLLNNQYTINNNQCQLDISALPDGMYFLHIRTEAGAAVHKVVLQR